MTELNLSNSEAVLLAEPNLRPQKANTVETSRTQSKELEKTQTQSKLTRDTEKQEQSGSARSQHVLPS